MRLGLAIARLYRQSEQRGAADELTNAQLCALWRLRNLGTARLSDLAAAEAVAMPSMTRTIAQLVTLGLVQRSVDPTNARAMRLVLTRHGHERIRRQTVQATESLACRVSALTHAEQIRLHRAIPILEALLE
jgi:DNA-binding MarR family transcriptional regulator